MSMEPDAKTFFISYAREDADFALKLSRDLREAGANLWMDQLDIKTGERWDRSIEKALEICSGMLLVLSPDSVNSANVMDEVSYGLEEGKRILPVMHRECKLPFRLRRVQYVDFTEGYEEGLKRLVRDMQVKGAQSGTAPPEKQETQPSRGREEPSAEKKEEVHSGQVQAEKTVGPIRKTYSRTGARPSASGTGSQRKWIIDGAAVVLLLLAVVLGNRFFRSERGPVLRVTERNGKFGYVDAGGGTIIPFEFDEATPFQNGKAKVRMGDHWFLINRRGECTDNCPEADPEEEAWVMAERIHTTDAYRGYLQDFPDGRHVEEAKLRFAELSRQGSEEDPEQKERRLWDFLVQRNTIEGFERYLRNYPDGRYAGEARERLQELRMRQQPEPEENARTRAEESEWERVVSENSIAGYKRYLETYPRSKYAADVERRLKALTAEDSRSRKEEEDRVYELADEMPQFPGGSERMYSYISRNIEYPPQLRREGVEGRVYVSIIVERDGRITGPEVLRTTHPDFGAASIRMVEQLMEQGIKFEPGKIDGEPVPVKMTIPITFKL